GRARGGRGRGLCLSGAGRPPRPSGGPPAVPRTVETVEDGALVTVEQLAADLAGKAAALNRLADHLARHDPYAALPSLLDDEPAAVVLLGVGAGRYACQAAGARLRAA